MTRPINKECLWILFVFVLSDWTSLFIKKSYHNVLYSRYLFTFHAQQITSFFKCISSLVPSKKKVCRKRLAEFIADTLSIPTSTYTPNIFLPHQVSKCIFYYISCPWYFRIDCVSVQVLNFQRLDKGPAHVRRVQKQNIVWHRINTTRNGPVTGVLCRSRPVKIRLTWTDPDCTLINFVLDKQTFLWNFLFVHVVGSRLTGCFDMNIIDIDVRQIPQTPPEKNSISYYTLSSLPFGNV